MNYLIALFGSFLWNYALFVVAKNNCDNAIRPVDFEYGKYFKMNWDNWVLTFLLAGPVVWFLPEIASLANGQLAKFNIPNIPEKLFALSAGVLSELLIFGLLKLAGLKQSIVPPIHK